MLTLRMLLTILVALTLVGCAAPAGTAGTPVGRAGVPGMTERALPAVVSITTRRIEQDEFNKRIRSAALGSGIIVDPRGYILTNEHVLRGAEVIKVSLTDGRRFEAALIGADRFTDLALLKVGATDLKALPLGDSSRLRIGETVVAIGSPLWIEGGPTVTVGVISGMGRSMEDGAGQSTLHDLLQTDAAINSGNSGGPLLNLAGQVVGINTAIMESAHGIGFVIPVNNAKPIYQALLQGRRFIRPSLGVVAVSLTPQLAFVNHYPIEHGALVVKVGGGTPAAAIGLQRDDIILAVGEDSVDDLHHYHAALFRLKPGDRVHLTVWRAGDILRLTATLGQEQP